MPGWRNAAALDSIRREADRRWPGRSHASDGTLGDARHRASKSDHNPDFAGVVHAIDLTNDPEHGFDAWEQAQRIGRRMLDGREQRVEYLVSNDGTHDKILNPTVSRSWRDNNAEGGQSHRSHLHVSIKHTPAAEGDTTPFFDPGLTPDQIAAIERQAQEDEVERGMAVDTARARGDRLITLDRWGGLHSDGVEFDSGLAFWPHQDVARKVILTDACAFDKGAPLAGWVQDKDGVLWPFADRKHPDAKPPGRTQATWKGEHTAKFEVGD